MEKKLSENWITESHIDFEYKKYLLLAYLQHVSERFEETRLYPALSELVRHYRNLVKLREQKKNMFERFPEKLNGTDWQGLQLVYEKLCNDDDLMKEIENIISFSIPQFELHLSEGRKIYDLIESKLSIQPVGIVPLHTDAGYLLLQNGDKRETVVYEFGITIFDQSTERYRAISTRYIDRFESTLGNTYENIKGELISVHPELPNPATYAITSPLTLPMEETLLPLAKRTLVKFLNAA